MSARSDAHLMRSDGSSLDETFTLGDSANDPHQGSVLEEDSSINVGFEDGGFLGSGSYEDEDLSVFVAAALGEPMMPSLPRAPTSARGALVLAATGRQSAQVTPRLLPLSTGGTPLDTARSAASTSASSVGSLKSVDQQRIDAVFERFDGNRSDDLDVFELSGAVEALVGVRPATPQVAAMVNAAGAAKTNRLSRSQFRRLVQTFDFDAGANRLGGGGPAPDEGLGASVYELEFFEEKLGFRVRNVEGGDKTGISGKIVVSHVVSTALEGLVGVGDTVLAVNGAPLGIVKDHTVTHGSRIPQSALFLIA